MPRKNAKERFDYEKTEPLTDLSFDYENTEPLTDFSLIPCYDHPEGKNLDVPVQKYFDENQVPVPRQSGSTGPVAVENDSASTTMADAEQCNGNIHESGEMVMAAGIGDGMPVVNSKQFQNSNVIINVQSQVQVDGPRIPEQRVVLGEASNEPLIPPSAEVQVDAPTDTSTLQEPTAEGTFSSSGNDLTPIANPDSIVSLDPNGNVKQGADFIPEIIQLGSEVSSTSPTPSTSQFSIEIAYETDVSIIDEFPEVQVENDEHQAYPPAIEMQESHESHFCLVLVSDQSEQEIMFHANAEMETLQEGLELVTENLPESDTPTCPDEQIKETDIPESQRENENKEFPAVLSPVAMENYPPHNYDDSSTSTRVGVVVERNETESDTATEMEGLLHESEVVEEPLFELGVGSDTPNPDPDEPNQEMGIAEFEPSMENIFVSEVPGEANEVSQNQIPANTSASTGKKNESPGSVQDSKPSSQSRLRRSERLRKLKAKHNFRRTDKTQAIQHLQVHLPTTPKGKPTYSCGICHKSGLRQGSMMLHIRASHKNKQPFSCEPCGKTFMYASQLKHHQQIKHSDSRPFVCRVKKCGKAFKEAGNLKHHQEYVHSDSRPFVCRVKKCGKTFKEANKLKQHQRNVHSDSRPFVCRVKKCGKAFKQAGNLKHHQEYVHTDSRPFVCLVKKCGKTFKEAGNLKHHQEYFHSDSRPFVCRVKKCGKAFKEAGNLKQHQEYVHLPKKFKCKDCNKRFGSMRILKLHTVSVHEMEHVRVVCPICNRSLRDRYILKTHLTSARCRKQTPQCEFCNKSFSNSFNLKRHQANVHGGTGNVSKPTSSLHCGICNVTLKSREAFVQHQNAHERKAKAKESKTKMGKTQRKN